MLSLLRPLHLLPLRWGLALAMTATLLATPVAHAALTANVDGTVTDSATNLVWDQCAHGLTGATCASGSAFYGDWVSVLAQASSANTAVYKGFSDWRVPSKNELESIVKLDTYSPAIDATAFPNTPSSDYSWTSTTYASDPSNAWIVNFNGGSTNAYFKTNYSFVRLVRSGQSFSSFDALLPVVNGSCGSAHATTPLVTSAPSGGALCASGTAGSITAGNSAYTWACAGSNGGSASGTCSASRGYTVTPSAGANGSISPSTAQVVAYNATPAFTVTPSGGYGTSVGGSCGGALSGSTYSTNAIAGDCTVSASFSGNDTTPDAFSFTAVGNAVLSALQTSASITVAGITMGAAISVTGGEYSINSGGFVSTAGVVNNGDSVAVRHTASATYKTATTTTLNIGGVTASYVSTTAAPPPAPEPPPTPVVEQGSNLTLSGGPFEVRANAVNGTVLTFSGPTRLQLANGGGLLQVQPEPTGTTARLAFVAGPQGEPVPRLLSGRARFTAADSGQPLLGWLQSLAPASAVVLNAGACTGTPTELLAEVNESTGQTLITVLGCQVALPAALAQSTATRQTPAAAQARAADNTATGAEAAAAMTRAVTPTSAILSGEYVVLNALGQVQEMGLGSATGDQGLTGDNVARTATPGLVWMHTRPMLNGTSVRLGRNVAQAVVNLLSTQAQFSEFTNGGNDGLLVASQGGKRVVLGALGRVTIDPGSTQPDSWQASGQAAHTLGLGGLGMTWAPALADAEGFARLLTEHGGSTVVQADGTLLVTLGSNSNNGAAHFAVQAGEQLEPPTSVGGFGLSPAGVLTYTNRIFGYPQTLYPAAADFAALRTAVLAADLAGDVLGLGQGRIKVVLGGQTYTLRPDMALVPLPAQHAGKTVWLEGQPVRLYLPVASLPGFAQGFAVE